MWYLILILILACVVLAFANWRWGIVAAVAVGLLQDPLRKLIPGAPPIMAMTSLPVWFAALLSAAHCGQLPAGRFLNSYPRLGWWIHLFALYLLIPATISATWGAGTWKITLLGAFVYFGAFAAIVAGWEYARTPADFYRLLAFYAFFTSGMLIGGPLDFFGWSQRTPLIGTTALGHIWVTHRPGAPVYMLAGFFRSPDIMGWHASLVFMVALILAFRSRGIYRWLWMLIGVWGVLNIWLCGRRKMLAMIPIFLGSYLLLICWFKNVRRILATLSIMVLISGAGWYFISSVFYSEAVEKFYLTTIEEADDRFEKQGIRSIFTTIQQAGFWGYGLGMSQQGVHNIPAEKPRLWQESGPPKLVAELGVPGAVIFAGVSVILLITAVAVIRQTRHIDLFYSQAGILSILLANATSSIVSAQIFGDPLVAMLLSFLTGLMLSANRLLPAVRREVPPAAESVAEVQVPPL